MCIVHTGPPQPVAPTAPPLSAIEEQPYGLHAYQQPPQNAPRATTTTTTTTYTTVTTTEDTVITNSVHGIKFSCLN